MLNALTKLKSALIQPNSQPPALPPASAPAEEPPALVIPTQMPTNRRDSPALTPQSQAVETARQVGYLPGDEVDAAICRHQPARHNHLLFVEVPGWSVPVRCWVKDAAAWLPATPPHNRLKARFTGTASVEGDLIFESASVSRRERLLRSRK